MAYDPVAANLSESGQDIRTYINERNSLLLPPSGAEGISGFIFDVPGEDSIVLNSDITDHYAENNSFVNDHVVLRPIEITLSGYMGPLSYKPPQGVRGALRTLNSRLEEVDGYLGDRTPGFVQESQQVINRVERGLSTINRVLSQGRNIVGLFAGEDVNNDPQRVAFRTLVALRNSRQIVSIQTPWAFFDGYIIKNVGFTQGEESEFISDIRVTLKEFRVTETEIIQYDESIFPNRAELQDAETEVNGAVQGVEQTTDQVRNSFAFDIVSGVTQ
jgi:hypothetical protein